MTRALPARRRRIAGLGALLLAGAWAGAATPQDGVGRSLTIGTSLGAVANDNLDLVPGGQDGTVSATAGLDFRLLTATPLDSFALSGSLGLRAADGPGGDDTSDGLSTANLRLDYGRAVRDSRLSVSGYLARRQIAYLDLLDRGIGDGIGSDLGGGLEEGIDDPVLDGLGDPLILEDLDVVSQDGTQLTYGLDTTLELRRTAPLGVTLSAGLSGRRYDETGTSNLEDSDRTRVGIGLRFDFDEITRGSLDLDHATFEEENDPRGRRGTTSISTQLTRTLPRGGSIGLDLDLVSTEDGERYVAQLSRSLDLPLWSISGSLGVTRSENGDVLPTGRLTLGRALPVGSASLGLTRRVVSGSDDDERRVTAVSFDYSRPLTRLTTMGLDLSYISSDATGSGETESFGRAGVSLRHALSEDWSLNVGFAHRIEDEGDVARDNQISVNLRRQVTFRP